MDRVRAVVLPKLERLNLTDPILRITVYVEFQEDLPESFVYEAYTTLAMRRSNLSFAEATALPLHAVVRIGQPRDTAYSTTNRAVMTESSMKYHVQKSFQDGLR